MAFIHSMHLRANNHAPASMELMCGVDRPGLPSAGAWVTYGLGADNQNLPAFVVLHETRPRGDDQIWSAGFLPKTYQALTLDARRKEVIDNLARDGKHSDAQQRAQQRFRRAPCCPIDRPSHFCCALSHAAPCRRATTCGDANGYC